MDSVPLPLSSMSALQLVRNFNNYIDVVDPPGADSVRSGFALHRATFLTSVAKRMLTQV